MDTESQPAKPIEYYHDQKDRVFVRDVSGHYNLTAELQRLRSLRELLSQHDIGLSDVAFAKRLRDDPELARAVTGWLEAWTIARRPEPVPNSDWLRFEQDKCRKLLASAAA